MPPIRFEEGDLVTCLDFLPVETTKTLAVGQITGAITLYSVDDNTSRQLTQFTYHKSSCRALEFCPTPGKLISVDKDKMMGIVDTTAWRLLNNFSTGHSASPNALKWCNENVFATGDDDGEIKIWDSRDLLKPIFTMKEHDDYISDFEVNVHKKLLISVSGDCTLAAWDFRKGKLIMQSEEFRDDLTSVVSIRGGRKVAVSTITGSIIFYNWGQWELHNDRWPACKESIDKIIELDDNTLITGAGDGEIRLVSLFPHKVLGVVGAPSNTTVSSMALHKTKEFLATSSTEHIVRFWNLGPEPVVEEDSGADSSPDAGEEKEEKSDSDEDNDDAESGKKRKRLPTKMVATDKAKKRKLEFFADV